MTMTALRPPPLIRLTSPPPNPRRSIKRHYAISSPIQPAIQVFNTPQKLLQRHRAATLNPALSRNTDYVRNEICARLATRLLDINRNYPRVLDYGAQACQLSRILAAPSPDPDSAKPVHDPIATKIQHLVSADASPAMLHRDESLDSTDIAGLSHERLVLPDMESVPFPDESFDLVMSVGSLHWINDLPSVLTHINRVLKPDCAFLGAMPGGDTLYELRGSLQLAEQERRGGIAAHVSPLADVRDVGNLLGRAGFKLLTVDVDDIVVSYPDVMSLLRDLQGMGEGNASLRMEKGPIGRDVLLAVEGIYRELYGDEDGSIPATFRTIYMIGWKEGEGQASPMARGTGDVNLKEFLEGGGKP